MPPRRLCHRPSMPSSNAFPSEPQGPFRQRSARDSPICRFLSLENNIVTYKRSEMSYEHIIRMFIHRQPYSPTSGKCPGHTGFFHPRFPSRTYICLGPLSSIALIVSPQYPCGGVYAQGIPAPLIMRHRGGIQILQFLIIPALCEWPT